MEVGYERWLRFVESITVYSRYMESRISDTHSRELPFQQENLA